MHRLWIALTIMVCLMVMLACGVDADDRMVRRYAGCTADANTVLHRLTASSAVRTVPLSAEAVEERVRDQLERGELAMAEIRADYTRYCEQVWVRVAEMAWAKGAWAGPQSGIKSLLDQIASPLSLPFQV